MYKITIRTQWKCPNLIKTPQKQILQHSALKMRQIEKKISSKPELISRNCLGCVLNRSTRHLKITAVIIIHSHRSLGNSQAAQPRSLKNTISISTSNCHAVSGYSLKKNHLAFNKVRVFVSLYTDLIEKASKKIWPSVIFNFFLNMCLIIIFYRITII